MRAEITATATGAGTKILLDGIDVVRAVRGLSFDASVDNVPQLTLDLILIDGTSISSEFTYVQVPAETAKVLKQLGWTPPADPALPDGYGNRGSSADRQLAPG